MNTSPLEQLRGAFLVAISCDMGTDALDVGEVRFVVPTAIVPPSFSDKYPALAGAITGLMIQDAPALDDLRDAFSYALQADLEHGVAWMNEEASKEFNEKYPFLCVALQLVAELEELG
jgi:hypothetical protein